MTDFSQNIKDFVQYGTYNYVFDDTGNLTFDISSSNFNQVYLSLPLDILNYNNSKIGSFYTINFQEFIPQSTASAPIPTINDLQNQLNMVQQQNSDLQLQLNNVISQVSSVPSTPTTSSLATQQVILELRIALGQGLTSADFSSDFPYTPLNKTS